MINSSEIDALRDAVGQRMSEHRYRHTLGVEQLAASLGELVMPERVNELRCAALLHDISKELPPSQQLSLIDSEILTEDDIKTPAIYHSLSAPAVIKRDFPSFATPDILSAVLRHTTGAPDMSLFDEIIFISDFAEAGREYESCRAVAAALECYLSAAKNHDERVLAIHKATLDTLNATISALERMKKQVNQRTLLTKTAFVAKI